MNIYLVMAMQSSVSLLLFMAVHAMHKGGSGVYLSVAAFVLQVAAFVGLLTVA